MTQDKSKRWFDNKTALVFFTAGDKVLVLLPLNSKLLEAKYCGPYEVLEKLGLWIL